MVWFHTRIFRQILKDVEEQLEYVTLLEWIIRIVREAVRVAEAGGHNIQWQNARDRHGHPRIFRGDIMLHRASVFV
jgi:hypothetical protein